MNPQIKHLEKEGIKVGSQVVYNGTIVEDYTNGFDDSWAGEDLEEGKIYIVKSINTESGSLKLKNTGYVYNHPISCFNVVSEDKKFPFFLHLEDAQKIIDCACSEWKKKLLEMWAKRLILNGKVTISKEFYKEMRSSCTKEQHKLFDEIFGKDNQVEIPEKGTLVYCTDNKNGLVTQGYYLEYEQGVLFPHRISSKEDEDINEMFTYCSLTNPLTEEPVWVGEAPE